MRRFVSYPVEAPNARHRLVAPPATGVDFAFGYPASIGPYELLEPLGEGGVGVVFRARHRESGAFVALKTVRVRDTAHLSSVRREILALRRLSHPGIVKILEGGVEGGRPWYAMELLSGSTLLQAIGGSPGDASTLPSFPTGIEPVPEDHEQGSGPRRRARPAAGGRLDELLTLFRLLCAPLAYLHGEGIVHRDIKPGNVFIRPDGTPVLMDFGLVGRWRGALGRDILADTQAFGGTLVYMAPEQIKGELGDARSDLYALGATLYEALTGMVPFEDFASGSGSEEPELGLVRPSEIVLGVPPGLDELVVRLLAKDPRDRIGHADDVAAALAALGARDWPRGGVLPRGRSYLYQPRLVGRASALSAMLEGVDSSRKLGGLLLLGGESGIGKTSLAAEVARVAYQREYEVVTSECQRSDPDRYERSAPLLPFRPLLRHIVEHCSVGGPATTARVVGPRLKLLAAVEPSFLQLAGSGEAGDPPSLPVAAALERMLAALAETIVAFAHETASLLVVIDDLHWADGLSLALLARLGAQEGERTAGRLVMLGTYRTEEAGVWLSSLVELPRTLQVELDRLADDDVARMVADMLGVTTAPPDLARFVARESEGNPFFVGEYLRTALDSGLLYRDAEGRWHQGESSSNQVLGLPNTLRELVERRLAALSPNSRILANLAAVMGNEIEPDLLLSLGQRRLSSRPATEPELASELRELCARHVLVETPRETLAFSHETLRKVTYASIAEGERRAMHGLVAEAIEARDGEDRAGEHAPVLAHHCRAAGDLPRALDHLERAGELALAHSAGAEAASYFRDALKLDREAGLATRALRRARWEANLGRALQGIGDLDDGKRHLERAVALFGWSVARTPLGRVLQTLAGVLVQLWHRVLGRGEERSPAAGKLLDAARAYDHLLQIHYYRAEPLPLLQATLSTLNLAERAGPSPELASAYANTFAGLALTPGLKRYAPGYRERAERTLAQAPDRAVESYLCLLKGIDCANRGRWAEGEPAILRAIELADELGYRRRWEEATSVRAYNLALRGQTQAALDAAESVYRSSLRGDAQTRCWSLIERAQAKRVLGALDDACRDLEAAAALSEGLGRDERLWVSGLQSLAELEAGDVPRATTLADRTLAAMGRRLPLVSAAGAAYAAVAEACLELYARADAAHRAERLAAARTACRALARLAEAFPFMRAHSELAAGDLARCLGDEARARAAFAAAAACAEQCDLLPVLELVRERTAEMDSAPGAPA